MTFASYHRDIILETRTNLRRIHPNCEKEEDNARPENKIHLEIVYVC